VIPDVLSKLVPERIARRLVVLGVTAALAVATLRLVDVFDGHHAVERWLAWRYLRAWGAVAFFTIACLSVGNRVVRALSRPGERQDAHVTLSFATGTFIFGTLTFVVGVAGALNTPAFFLIPLALLAVGARRLIRDLVLFRAERGSAPWIEPFSVAETAAFCAGAVAVAVLYVSILVPENAGYDARWYHMGLAEHYVATGRIERLPEGFLAAAVPQLASMLYAWAYLQPETELFDRVQLCAHLEFTIFLFMLAGIPALVRYLVPGVRARASWVAFFLFPSIFVYDHSLQTGSDHIATLWTVPVYLVTARALRELDARTGLLLAMQISGLLLTKYTAAPAALLPAVALPLRAVFLTVEHLRGRRRDFGWVFGLATLVGAGLVFTSQHWLKNFLWYGDPVYPLLNRHLSVRPWIPESAFYLEAFQNLAWSAQGTVAEKLDGAKKVLRDYHYELYGWEIFYHRKPVVGSLFAVGLLALPLLRFRGRLWMLVLVAHLGIVAWWLLFHDTRYLRPLIPLFTAGIVALGIGCFRLGWGPRLGVVALATVQGFWGLGMIFWPVHQMTGRSGIGAAAEYFARGFSAPESLPPPTFSEQVAIGRGLPNDAVVLVHHEHVHTGIGRRTVTDWLPVQIGLDYGALGSLRGVHKKLTEFGVTHITWAPGTAYADTSLAAELLFHTYVERYATKARAAGSHKIAQLASRVPAKEPRGVFYFGCDSTYQSGLYEMKDLAVSPLPALGHTAKYPRPRKALTGSPTELLDQAGYAVIMRCAGAPTATGFESLAKNTTAEFFVRKKTDPPK